MVDYCDYSRATSKEEVALLLLSSQQQVKPTNGEEEASLEVSASVTAPTANTKSEDANFPTRLHYALSETEKDGLCHIVSWHPHGRSFKVHKPDEFVDQVLRRWFRQNKLTSFQRQLNIYGFTRITSGPDKNGYYHERFLRGKIFLTYGLPRMHTKGNRTRRSANTDGDVPNFYAMPFLPSSDTPPLTSPSVAPISTNGNCFPSAAMADDPSRPQAHGMKEVGISAFMKRFFVPSICRSVQMPGHQLHPVIWFETRRLLALGPSLYKSIKDAQGSR